MAIVQVEPGGFEIDVRPGEALAVAAWRLGYTWPTRCWGQAECMACYVTVLRGEAEADLSPASDYERLQMRTLMPRRILGPRTRLACQLCVQSDGLVVEKKGVRPPIGSPPTDQPEDSWFPAAGRREKGDR